MNLTEITAMIRDIPDFPKPGIIYKDITPLLQDAEAFNSIIENVAKRYQNNRPDYIAGIEARGFIFGAALALRLNCGFIPVRKAGKLPYKTLSESYQLEYGEATLEIHADAVKPGDKVVLLDDLLATGGTVVAALNLLRQLEAEVVGIEFIIELTFLNGRAQLDGYQVNSLLVS